MKASVQYNDFKGTAAADISDFIAKNDGIEDIARYFELDFERFNPIGISIYGTKNPSVSLICVDKERSTQEKEFIVQLYCETEDDDDILSNLFKRLNIVLYGQFDKHYSTLDYDEERRFDEFHEAEDE